jgi:hypothetical protein
MPRWRVTLVASGLAISACGAQSEGRPPTPGSGSGGSSQQLAGSSGSQLASGSGGAFNLAGGGAAPIGSGGNPGACFSPIGHLDLVFTPDGQGCACEASAPDVCIAHVILSCRGGRWQSVDDVPCRARLQDEHTPESCAALGGIPTPSDPVTYERFCESHVSLGPIGPTSGEWKDGGACCAPGKPLNLVQCGGFSAHSCYANEYCAYLEEQMCGQADASSVCRPRPTSCDDFLAPVCGCDGKTYGNACYAHLAGMGLMYAEPCEGH